MRLLISSLAVAGLLVGCAPVETPPAGGEDAAPTQCRAERYQHLIGRNRSELPEQPAGETWRVACTTCAVTMDYNPSRLNIFFEEDTGVIRRVECG